MRKVNKANKQGIINRDVNAATRAAYALQLRAKRLTFDEIAKQAGYASPGAARNAIQRELQRTLSENTEELRREELDMLNRLHAAVWPLAIAEVDAREEASEEDEDKPRKRKGPNLFAVDRILKISEQRCRLMGIEKKPEEELNLQPYTKRIILTHEKTSITEVSS